MDHCFAGAMGGGDDDRGLDAALTRFFDDFGARFPRHHHVKNGDVDLARLQSGGRCRAVIDRNDDKTLLGKEGREQLTGAVVVFGKEQAGQRGHLGQHGVPERGAQICGAGDTM